MSFTTLSSCAIKLDEIRGITIEFYHIFLSAKDPSPSREEIHSVGLLDAHEEDCDRGDAHSIT